MGGVARHPRVRLAELVAALSLGVDLGFGQPMEHVLRQCLIALRLAEHAGLDEQDRMAVYYTALLVNVGCHADAHEQAKWFGDDIALKSGKYAYELGSVRGRWRPCGWSARVTRRCTGSGSGSSSPSPGIAQLDGMISQHARLARTLAEQLELPGMVREAVGAAYEQWDGRGWPGTLKARRSRSRPGSPSSRSSWRWRTASAAWPGRDRAGPQAGGQAVRPGAGRAAVRAGGGDLRRSGGGPGLAYRDRGRARAGRGAVAGRNSTGRWRPSRTSWT